LLTKRIDLRLLRFCDLAEARHHFAPLAKEVVALPCECRELFLLRGGCGGEFGDGFVLRLDQAETLAGERSDLRTVRGDELGEAGGGHFLLAGESGVLRVEPGDLVFLRGVVRAQLNERGVAFLEPGGVGGVDGFEMRLPVLREGFAVVFQRGDLLRVRFDGLAQAGGRFVAFLERGLVRGARGVEFVEGRDAAFGEVGEGFVALGGELGALDGKLVQMLGVFFRQFGETRDGFVPFAQNPGALRGQRRGFLLPLAAHGFDARERLGALGDERCALLGEGRDLIFLAFDDLQELRGGGGFFLRVGLVGVVRLELGAQRVDLRRGALRRLGAFAEEGCRAVR